MPQPQWKPVTSQAILAQRAKILADIRQFFLERGVLEVETPLVGKYSVTDPFMKAITTDNPVGSEDRYYLQTSPEYAMKRMLADGFGAIFQICKAFRQGEHGSRHNPEFTLLEWYRPGFDHLDLMAELARLLEKLMPGTICTNISYHDLFQQHFNINPHRVDCSVLETIAREHIDLQMDSDNRDDWLNLIISEIIEPQLGRDHPQIIFDYPASQAALAKTKIDSNGDLVAERFELYSKGLELANGYHELTDAKEQRRRFDNDNTIRRKLNKCELEIDQALLDAMEDGLPECAGVALGIDRLIMWILGLQDINQVMSFSIENA